MNPATDMTIRLVRSGDGRSSALVHTNNVSGKAAAAAKLVFNRYGDQYFFSQAWLPADSTGRQTSKSRSEKQIARELAATRISKEFVAITARR